MKCKTFTLSWDKENTYVKLRTHSFGDGRLHMSFALVDTPEKFFCLTIEQMHITFTGEVDLPDDLVLQAKDNAWSSISEKEEHSWTEINKIVQRARRLRLKKNRKRAVKLVGS